MNEYNSFNQTKGLTWINHYNNIIRWHKKRKQELYPPIGITIDLTTTCNLRCQGCNSVRSWDKNNSLCKEEVFKIIDYLVEWRTYTGRSDVLLSCCFAGGGEPTLHKDFPEIIEYASKYFEIGMSTNGTTLNNKRVREAIVKYADFCGVSVDSATPETWGKYKQVEDEMYYKVLNGTKKTLKYINKLGNRKRKHKKLDFVYKFLITQTNQHEILQAAMLAMNIGFKTFFVRPAAMAGLEAFSMEDETLDVRSIEQQVSKARSLSSRQFKVYGSFGRVNPVTYGKVHNFKKCYATPLLVQICGDGYVYQCIDCRYKANHRMCPWDKLRGYWGSQTHKSRINKLKVKDCPRCAFGVYNEQIEKCVIEDQLWRNFP